jgi:hypothetical protein
VAEFLRGIYAETIEEERTERERFLKEVIPQFRATMTEDPAARPRPARRRRPDTPPPATPLRPVPGPRRSSRTARPPRARAPALRLPACRL